jgi:CheY-like chemotaxis protein
MPTIDGRAFVNISRGMGCRSLVLVMSAYDATTAAEELRADGALDKPFDLEKLLREVRRLLPSAVRT